MRGPETPTKEEAYTKALRYPICNRKVLGVLGNSLKDLRRNGSTVPLPRYLFKSLQPPEIGWNKEDHPIPTLRYLYQDPNIPPIDSNAHGYALARAVHARFVPLIQFLLDHNASPRCRKNLAVEVAIRQKDLEMVKLLVERPQSTKKNGKRRKVEDRVKLDSSLLKTAVMANAQDIVRYLYTEKGVIPDVETLKRLSRLDVSFVHSTSIHHLYSLLELSDSSHTRQFSMSNLREA